MKDEDARRLSPNHCVTDTELAEIELLIHVADRGEWRVGPGPSLERHGGKPFEKPDASYRFAAASIGIVPRLVKGLRFLEERFAFVRAEIAGLKNELSREREDAKIAALNRAEGRTGPEWEPAQIARLAELWAALPEEGRHSNRNVGDAIAAYFRRWIGGESVGADVRSTIDDMERRLAEHVKFRTEWEAEQKATIERTRELLRGWIVRLEAGEVPAEMAAQWARKTKEERKKFLAERKAAS